MRPDMNLSKSTSEPPTRAVIRAVRDLGDRHGRWPTAQEIADYLELPLKDIQAALKILHDERIFRPREQQGRRVWMPWDAS